MAKRVKDDYSNVVVKHQMLDGRIVDSLKDEKIPDDHPIHAFLPGFIRDGELARARKQLEEERANMIG